MPGSILPPHLISHLPRVPSLHFILQRRQFIFNIVNCSNTFRSTLPVVSNLTAMNIWDGFSMFFIYASLLEFVFVNYIGRKRPRRPYEPGDPRSSAQVCITSHYTLWQQPLILCFSKRTSFIFFTSFFDFFYGCVLWYVVCAPAFSRLWIILFPECFHCSCAFLLTYLAFLCMCSF